MSNTNYISDLKYFWMNNLTEFRLVFSLEHFVAHKGVKPAFLIFLKYWFKYVEPAPQIEGNLLKNSKMLKFMLNKFENSNLSPRIILTSAKPFQNLSEIFLNLSEFNYNIHNSFFQLTIHLWKEIRAHNSYV